MEEGLLHNVALEWSSFGFEEKQEALVVVSRALVAQQGLASVLLSDDVSIEG